MSSTILLIVLLCAHITGLISEQLLNATVGGSVLINCSLPGYPLTFFWQEGKHNVLFHWKNGNIIEEQNKYENRSQIFPSGFSSRNISIKLNNISVEDDQKTFFAIVNLYEQPNIVSKSSEKQCRSTLQVSAPYQDLVLMVKDTTNSATCSARGGYPAAQVSWKGLNRSSDEQLDLQGAETSPLQDPTEKTFSFTSSVSLTGLKSVTCIVYNPHSQETRNRTENIPDENEKINVAAIVVPVVLVILIPSIAGAVWFYVQYKRQHQDPPNTPPVDPNAQEPAPAPEEDPDQAQAPGPDPANQPPVEPNPQDGAQAEDADAAEPAQDPVQEEAADASEEAVLLSKDRAEFHRQTKTGAGTADCDTDEDAADSPEKEKLLENRTSVSENLDQN